MASRRFSCQASITMLAILLGVVSSHASAPSEEELGSTAATPPEATTGEADPVPGEPETVPPKEAIPPDDLRDFGIPSEPVLNLPPVSGERAAGSPPVPPTAPTSPVTSEDPPERILWNKTPIRVTLPVGRERLVHFPADVRVGMPSPPPPGLRTQSIGGTVYWYAREPFPTTRVPVQELANGQMVLLDLQAQPDADTTPIQILWPASADPSGAEPDEQRQTAPDLPHATATFVQLTRYAAQQLYAPRRLVHELSGIYPVPVQTHPVPLVRGSQVEARPLIAWRSGDAYVTAVRLQNQTGRAVILDPRDLRGQWLAASFQHGRLLPQGDEADTTCVYLISARPFAEALRGRY